MFAHSDAFQLIDPNFELQFLCTVSATPLFECRRPAASDSFAGGATDTPTPARLGFSQG
jgi:hypothetical protein